MGDCLQLKMDIDSFNANRRTAEPIQTSWDFTEDLREIEAEKGLDDAA